MEGVLIEEMTSGMELIIGAKIDYQFGPVILIGIAERPRKSITISA